MTQWKQRWAVVMVAAFSLTMVACGTAEDAGRGVPIKRGIGKADGTGSCAGVCGGQAIAGCWCDEGCEFWGDCCTDKSESCDKKPASCDGFCGKQTPSGCWCDDQCDQYGDCCVGRKETCDKTPPPASCTADYECKNGQFCKFKDGDCLLNTFVALQGVCTSTPQHCTFGYVPVCGCDGQTYDNACEADRASVSVASQGECKKDPPPVTKCTTQDECESDEYCKLKDGDCKLMTLAILQGTCTSRAQVCFFEYAPVCGCDDKTYVEACEAAAAGVSIAHSGECKKTPPKGDCYQNKDCAADEFCKLEDGACLYPTFAPIAGKCSLKPQACDFELLPVCSCDGKTYSNACFAAMAGASVASQDACK